MSDIPQPIFPPIGAVPGYADIQSWKHIFGNFHVWEGDGWKPESMAWKESAYLAANLTGPMEMVYRGPQAKELLSRLSINNVDNWEIGTSKHLVQTDERGLIANHGLAIRDSEDQYRQLAALPWPIYKVGQLGLDVEIAVNEIFILQIAGPASIKVIEKVLGRSIRDLAFLGIQEKIKLAGVDVEVNLELSRIGMTGNLAYEIRGPYSAGPAVYQAVYEAGHEFDIKRLGWRTYTVNHTEGGFPQVNCTFLPTVIEDQQFLSIFPVGLGTEFTGSADPTDVRARLRTPAEVNWSWMAKFDHDFLGRDAVEAEFANPRRKTVTLVWNPDDILDVFASHFRPGEEYKYIEFPVAKQQLAGGHADLVTQGGKVVGYASAAIYSYYYREVISQTVIDVDQAEIGNEVVVHWGDHGGRIKEIRAKVARFPYLDLPRNRDVDVTKL